MSRTFPQIKPSSREFRMGTYPTKIYRSLAGTTVKRSFGNKPHSYELGVEFQNIKDPVLEQILAHYDDTAGGFVRFALPSAIFAGMDTAIRARIQSPNGIQWEYAGPPEVQSVFNGVSTVSINFIGELNV
jgi:hypothetical protein